MMHSVTEWDYKLDYGLKNQKKNHQHKQSKATKDKNSNQS